METKKQVAKAKRLLKKVDREGMSELIIYLKKIGYFTAPAARAHHGNFRGGLCYHSVSVYETFKKLLKLTGSNLSEDTIIIVSLLHDLIKTKAYTFNENGRIGLNPDKPKGHCLPSIKMLEQYITLTPEEIHLIKYHMGIFESQTIDKKYGAYPIWAMIKVNNKEPLTMLFHMADNISATFIEKRDKIIKKEIINDKIKTDTD